jgi:two-component system nitrate/nitrite response regulator NarL
VRRTSTIILAGRTLLREGIASLLHNTAYKVTAAATAELEQIRILAGRQILAIVGIDDVNGNGSEITENIRLLRSMMPDAKIVILAERTGPIDLESVALLAADGYIINLGSRDILLKALELTLLTQQVFVLGPHAGLSAERAEASPHQRAPKFGDGPHSANTVVPLSNRERQVLICLAQGQSNKAIARLCQISEATVKVHLKAILRKTNARNRTQAAIWAIGHGLRDAALAHNRSVATDAPSLSPAEPTARIESEIAGSKS